MTVRIVIGDALETLRTLPDESVHCCVTSPPYWGLRDYGVEGQLGLERTPDEYIAKMVEVFAEVRRVLRADGTLWLNLGDSYHSGDRGGYRNDAHRWEKSELQRSNRGNAESIRPNRLPQDGLKDKDLVGMPWLLAFALRADGWWLRQDIVWSKPNPMPESVRDRCTKAHEYMFLLSKSERYYYDQDAIFEPVTASTVERLSQAPMKAVGRALGAKQSTTPGEVRSSASARFGRGAGWRDDPSTTPTSRNKRSVWEVATQPFTEAHFATFPPALIEPCILAGCPKGGTVLDPFLGAGTTGLVADRLGRNCIGIELNPAYAEMARKRIHEDAPLFDPTE